MLLFSQTLKLSSGETNMKWNIGNLEQECFVRVRLEDKFSNDEFIYIFEDLFSRDYWKLGMHILFDDSNLNLTDTTLEMIRHASACYVNNHSHIGDGKVAMLMRSLSDFARGRQFELLTGVKAHANINIFMDEAEAIQWLTEKAEVVEDAY
jgi:hypothetical protein